MGKGFNAFASSGGTGATCEHGTNIGREPKGYMSDCACAHDDAERHS